MVVKNKLYKHHKSKFVLAMRNFSIATLSLLALFGLCAIPTYINEKPIASAEAESAQHENSDSTDENEVEEPTLTYEEN